MVIHISKILKLEQIRFEPQTIVPLIDSSYPDIRKIINTCQLSSVKGILKLDTNNILDSDIKTKVLDILKSKDDKRNKYLKIEKIFYFDSRIQDFTEFYSFLYEKVDDYTDENVSSVILILSESQYRDESLVIDKEITFMTSNYSTNS